LVSAETTDLRRSIEDGLSKYGTGKVVARELSYARSTSDVTLRMDVGRVTSDGVIIAFNASYPALVVFEPSVNDKKVIWTCHVYPSSALPAECGNWVR
jgi:hypothetical protein